MPLTFDQADRKFKDGNINGLAKDTDGLRYLKIRSLSRPAVLRALFQSINIVIPETSERALFRAAFESAASVAQIEDFIKDTYNADRTAREVNEDELINQLYRLQEFNWGGLHQNSLEKTIVDNYVKKISNYDALIEAVEGDLHTSLRGYVTCSWYNHWTSIIIEDVFKTNPRILPAVGLVKQIDFFIDNVPYDLKVTYLPEGFVKDRRKEDGVGVELTILKRAARQFGVPINANLSDSALMQDLWTKIADHPDAECRDVVRGLDEFRSDLVTKIIEDPTQLIRWLYEEQGVRRFDASNRLFLILVDRRNYFDSWKLKRAKQLLITRIGEQLANGRQLGREINFAFNGQNYSVISDLLVVTNAAD